MSGPVLLRAVEAPSGLYFRPGRNDHTPLLQLLAAGNPPAMSGLVLDACLEDRHSELRTEARRRNLETVLDPRSVELGTPGGLLMSGVASLPWATEAALGADQLWGEAGSRLVRTIATHVAAKGYSAVLAPTHYIEGLDDPWLAVDGALTSRLRRELDQRGLQETPVYYPLVISGSLLRAGDALADRLKDLPLDALWLRVHAFGATSAGPVALHRYIEGARTLQAIGPPVVAERTGTVGLALLAFGAVGGIEGGITFGERFDMGNLLNPRPSDQPFAPPPRVYLPELGAFLTRPQAGALFENRQMRSRFGCRASCCRRGITDMLADPRRHFLNHRMAEVGRLGRAPLSLRPTLYLDDFLRPATDLALRAAQVLPALDSTRKRLEAWRVTLGAGSLQQTTPTRLVVPDGRRLRLRPSA